MGNGLRKSKYEVLQEVKFKQDGKTKTGAITMIVKPREIEKEIIYHIKTNGLLGIECKVNESAIEELLR